MEPAGVRRPPGTWTTSTRDSPRRNLTDLCAIAEIVRRFDVCAIQETHGDLTALRTLLRRIGPDWGVLVTDAGEGDAANDERLACVFDRRFVSLSGLVAGEMVIDECTFGDAATPLRRQFARGPFMTSFQAGPIDGRRAFTLVSLHVDYGRTAADRTPDLVTLAHRLKQRALEDDEFHHNFIALGDFTSIAGRIRTIRRSARPHRPRTARAAGSIFDRCGALGLEAKQSARP